MGLAERMKKIQDEQTCRRIALGENYRLREALEKIADPLTLQVQGIGMERALRTINTLQKIAKDALADA